jgi:hypothetical protein
MNIKTFYERLQPDIQTYFVDEFVKPQLMYDEMIDEFNRVIESEECQRLNWNVLIPVVNKIIHCKPAIVKMCELNTLGFKYVYEQHIIHKKKTFVRFDCEVSSMCAEFVMRKWH